MEQLTLQQETYCQRRIAGDTQRTAYRIAYPRAKTWKDNSVDRQASVLEALPKVYQRLETLKAQAAKKAKLTRSKLIDRIADVNNIAYEELKAEKKGINQSRSITFTSTSKQLLEFGLIEEENSNNTPVIDYGLLLPGAYIDIHRDIWNHEYTDYAFAGGRGSGKSSTVAHEIPGLLLQDRLYNAVILRQVFNTCRKSVYPKLKWAINQRQDREDFDCRLSPLGITYKPTGQGIYFLGLDDAEKLKSFTCETGYPSIIWFEEFSQFKPEEIRSALQSLSRGGSVFWRFYSWNPPRSMSNWVNTWVKTEEPGKIIHRSDYTMIPVGWLGEQFIHDALELKEINEIAYRHEYLGEAVGTNGEVFQNVQIDDLDSEEMAAMTFTRCGVDWGYAVDPWVFVRVAYDHKKKIVYIYDEGYGLRLSDEKTVKKIKESLTEREGENRVFYPRAPRNRIYADSSEPKSIATYKALGLDCVDVDKWPGSVEAGLKWLQTRTAIVIDRRRCPLTYQEFTGYEYETDKNDNTVEAYPDKNNHTIDAVRYALSPLISNKKEV